MPVLEAVSERNRYRKAQSIMKPATIIGAVLIVLAIVGFSLGGFSFTREKKDVNLGPVEVSHQQTKTVPIPPALSWRL